MFYTRTVFDVGHSYDVDALLTGGLFYTNPLWAPLKFVRSLWVTVSFQSHPEDDDYTDNKRKPAPDLELQAQKPDFERLIAHLSAIRQVKYAENFCLYLTLRTYHTKSLAKYQEVLVPLVYDLKAKGLKITLRCYQTRSPGNVDFTSEYDIPRAEWDAKIKESSAFVSEAQLLCATYV